MSETVTEVAISIENVHYFASTKYCSITILGKNLNGNSYENWAEFVQGMSMIRFVFCSKLSSRVRHFDTS